jgi:hypothetical protein
MNKSPLAYRVYPLTRLQACAEILHNLTLRSSLSLATSQRCMEYVTKLEQHEHVSLLDDMGQGKVCWNAKAGWTFQEWHYDYQPIEE